MPALSPERRAARARLAATKRHHPEADLAELLADLERSRLDERINELLAAAPQMTPEQAARLRPLVDLPPARVGEGGAAG